MRAYSTIAWLAAACSGDPHHPAPDAGCVPKPQDLHILSLAVPSGATYPAKLYVEVAPPSLFLLDTGSAQTFLREELGTPPAANAGTVAIGCDTLALPGYAEAPLGSLDGLDVTGTFGLDRLLSGPSLVDVEHAQLVMGGDFPEAASWRTAPFDLVQQTLLARVTLEGHDVRLLVDTGSDHTLWLGQMGQPGDTEIMTIDSAGNPLTEYLGTGDLAIGGVHATVPLVRAPSFPYLEQYFATLGGNIAGLLGLSSFARALEIDPAATVVRLE